MRVVGSLTYSVLLFVGTQSLDAQATGRVSVVSGTATDQRGVRSAALTVAPSVSYSADPRVGLVLFGSATRFAEEVMAYGGGAGLGARLPLVGPFAFTSSAQGALTRTSFDATFGAGDATGALELGIRGFAIEGGVQVAQGFTATMQPLVGTPLPGPSRRTTTARHGIGPRYAATWTSAPRRADRAVQVFARSSPLRVADAVIRDDEVGVAVVIGPVAVRGRLGRRDAPSERLDYVQWSAGVDVTRQLVLEVSGGQYPSDRLSGALGGRYLTTGLSLRFGGPPRPRAIRVRGVAPPTRGITRLAIEAPGAFSVEVAGDWNEWQRVPAHRADGDVWYVDLPLAPGEYRYTFLVDGKDWRVPKGAVAADDGFGSKVAWVTVRDT
jgi:hypothetical protein